MKVWLFRRVVSRLCLLLPFPLRYDLLIALAPEPPAGFQWWVARDFRGAELKPIGYWQRP